MDNGRQFESRSFQSFFATMQKVGPTCLGLAEVVAKLLSKTISAKKQKQDENLGLR